MWSRKDPAGSKIAGNDSPAERPEAAATPHRGDETTGPSIGQSIAINGEITGREDLRLNGNVEGRIDLNGHRLTIGPKGRIKADIHARAVTIHGQVRGNIRADDRVELFGTGDLQGDIVAPRIIIADGARFKGSVDMDTADKPARGTAGSSGGTDASSGAPRAAAPAGR